MLVAILNRPDYDPQHAPPLRDEAMSLKSSTTVAACSLLQLLTLIGLPIEASEPTRLLAEPAVSDRQIAFAYDRDLWLADRNGRNPRRLTSHEAVESSPRFSPDGNLIAFSAEYDGNLDVYIMPVNGGTPRRLTYHPSPDYVEGFTADGKAVLFSSTRDTFTRRIASCSPFPPAVGSHSSC